MEHCQNKAKVLPSEEKLQRQIGGSGLWFRMKWNQ